MRDDTIGSWQSVSAGRRARTRTRTGIRRQFPATAKTFLFRLESNDARAFAAALVSLSLAALIASLIPARRAASVDPMVALRAE